MSRVSSLFVSHGAPARALVRQAGPRLTALGLTLSARLFAGSVVGSSDLEGMAHSATSTGPG